MKSKLLILFLFACVSGIAQSVPNTNTFKLSDVTAITGGTTLSQAFTNSVDAYFDPTYKGSKDRLSNFRNYTVSACTQPSLISLAYVSGSQTSSTITASAEVYTDGTCTVTERGMVCATTPNPTTANFKAANGSGVGSYSATITGLAANTAYYVRGYYISSQGTVYVGTLNITTNP